MGGGVHTSGMIFSKEYVVLQVTGLGVHPWHMRVVKQLFPIPIPPGRIWGERKSSFSELCVK